VPLTLSGVGSNIDVEALVSQLMKVERAPLDRLTTLSQATSARVSAFGSLKGMLAAFQSTLEGLNAAKLSALAASSSDAAVAQAVATSGAAAGAHSLEVTTLAQAHRIHSQAFGSLADEVGTGTLTFCFGSWDGNTFTENAARPARSVTITAGQSSLSGVRDAVNAAGIGVSAAIVNDGIGERLIFTSAETGARMGLKVAVTDDDGTAADKAGLSRLAYDPAAPAGAGRNLEQSQAAADASFVLDGLAMTRPTNTVADALSGVTITIGKAAPGTTVTLNLTRDVAAAQAAVDSLVNGYNGMRKAIAAYGKYDPAGRANGALRGESLLRVFDARLRAAVSAVPAGLTGSYTTLAQAGLNLKADGTLALDAAKFQAALASDPEGLVRLLAPAARADDSRLVVEGFGTRTQPGSHAVTLTQAGTAASITGAAAPVLTITTGVNDTLSLSVDGVTATVTLAAGTYADATALAAHVGTKLREAGLAASVSTSAGRLIIASQRYGSGSTVSGVGGSAAAELLGSAPLAAVGTDAAGTIGGVAATGSGRTLVAATGSAAEGLRVRVESAATGAFGTVAYSRGYAGSLAAALAEVLDSAGGIDSRVEGLNAAIERYQARSEQLQRSLDATEKRLRAQFAALDSLMARMNQTSSYLTQQLANLPGSSKG
jgi:flagellar hook-associated protein 2